MKDGRSGISTIAEYAVHEFEQAEKLEKREVFNAADAIFNAREAEQARVDGERLLKPPKNLIGDASTEIVPAPEPGATVPNGRNYFLCTLASPDTISIDASEHRTAVATRAGVLSPALDAAKSARATSSIEKMLCHQMAAVHFAGMELLIRAEQSPSFHDYPPVEVCRIANAAARMFEVYQSACLTLIKLKNRGRQRVVVQHQHVNVEPGGQAVVAARVSGRCRKAKRPGP